MSGSVYNNGSARGSYSASALGLTVSCLLFWFSFGPTSYTTGSSYQYVCTYSAWAFQLEVYVNRSSGEIRFYSSSVGEVTIATGSSTTWWYCALIVNGTTVTVEVSADGSSSWTTVASFSVTAASSDVVFFDSATSAYLIYARLYGIAMNQAGRSAEKGSRVPVNTADLLAEWAGGINPTGASWATDQSGHSRPLSTTGAAVDSSLEPSFGGGSISVAGVTERLRVAFVDFTVAYGLTVVTERARVRPSVASAALAAPGVSERVRTVPSAIAATLGIALPSTLVPTRDTSVTSSFAGTQPTEHPRTVPLNVSSTLGVTSPAELARSNPSNVLTSFANSQLSAAVRDSSGGSTSAFAALGGLATERSQAQDFSLSLGVLQVAAVSEFWRTVAANFSSAFASSAPSEQPRANSGSLSSTFAAVGVTAQERPRSADFSLAMASSAIAISTGYALELAHDFATVLGIAVASEREKPRDTLTVSSFAGGQATALGRTSAANFSTSAEAVLFAVTEFERVVSRNFSTSYAAVGTSERQQSRASDVAQSLGVIQQGARERVAPGNFGTSADAVLFGATEYLRTAPQNFSTSYAASAITERSRVVTADYQTALALGLLPARDRAVPHDFSTSTAAVLFAVTEYMRTAAQNFTTAYTATQPAERQRPVAQDTLGILGAFAPTIPERQAARTFVSSFGVVVPAARAHELSGPLVSTFAGLLWSESQRQQASDFFTASSHTQVALVTEVQRVRFNNHTSAYAGSQPTEQLVVVPSDFGFSAVVFLNAVTEYVRVNPSNFKMLIDPLRPSARPWGGINVKNLLVRSLDVDHNEVSWELPMIMEDVFDYTFQVLRSAGPEGPYAPVSEPFQDKYLFVDNNLKYSHDSRMYFYKLRVRQLATGDAKDFGPSSKEPSVDLIAAELRKHVALLMREFIGRRCWVFPVRTFGQRCPNCYSVHLGKSTRSHCLTCFDTSFTGGYHQPIEAWISVDPTPKQTQQTNVGTMQQKDTTARLTFWPPLKEGDLVVEPENIRWRVTSVTTTEQVRAPVHQEVALHRIPSSDIEYRIPLHLEEALRNLWLGPSRNMSNPHDLESVEREDFPDLFQIYGATNPKMRR